MKLLILALSALLGIFVGLLYDLQLPVLAFGSLKLSGPALATSLSVSLILASGLIGLAMVSMRLDRLVARTNGPILFDTAPVMPRISMPEERNIESSHKMNPILIAPRLSDIDLRSLELRAER